MQDGLYQVTTKFFCAGFEIRGGKVTACAPILRRRIDYWMKIAKPVSSKIFLQENQCTEIGK